MERLISICILHCCPVGQVQEPDMLLFPRIVPLDGIQHRRQYNRLFVFYHLVATRDRSQLLRHLSLSRGDRNLIRPLNLALRMRIHNLLDPMQIFLIVYFALCASCGKILLLREYFILVSREDTLFIQIGAYSQNKS